MDEQWLLLTEVADIARAPLSTVRFWVRTGKLASTRPGRRRLVRRIDLDRFMEQGLSSCAQPDGGSDEPAGLQPEADAGGQSGEPENQ